MGGMAIVLWQKEKRLLEERYLNSSTRRTYIEATRKGGGLEDWNKALVWKCLNCMGARLRADGFFEGNRKAREWLTQGKGLDEVPTQSLGIERTALDVARYLQKLESRGFAWVIFKDEAISCLHQARCIYDKGICLLCGTESIPYISVGLEREGWAPILKNHRSYCMGCYQSEKLKGNEVVFLSGSRFEREKPGLRLLTRFYSRDILREEWRQSKHRPTRRH